MFDGVSALIDKSLLQQSEHEENGGEEPRFAMLETIREYGLEMLAASKDVETTRQAQALYYLRFAEEVEPKFFGAEQQRWYARMEQEHANLRTAMHWLQERKEVDLTLRLSCALWWFWLNHNHLNEGCQWLDQVLTDSEEGDLSLRAGVLNGFGLLLSNQGDFVQAKRRCEESVALFQELEDNRRYGLAAPPTRVHCQRRWGVHESRCTLRRVPGTLQRGRRQVRASLCTVSPDVNVQRARRLREGMFMCAGESHTI